MKRVDNANQGFKVPQSILTQLNEVSTGFLLFTLDENGNPHVYSYTDNIGGAQQLQNYARLWTEAAEEVNKEIIKGSMMGDIFLSDEDFESDDEQ